MDPGRLRLAYERGRRSHPDLELDFRAYMPSHGRVPRAVSDYYLARACEAMAPGSWERLQLRYQRRVLAYLVRRGGTARDAQQVLDEGWGWLSTPPQHGRTQTRIGLYDGSGSLQAWLATIMWRRLTALWRKRASEPETEPAEPEPLSEDPAATAAQDEIARRLGDALEDAWLELTERELEAMVLKYGHDMSQRDIARAMRVGAPRVTRLLQAGTARLRASIEERLAAHVDWQSGGWERLSTTVDRMLSRTSAELEVPETKESGDE